MDIPVPQRMEGIMVVTPQDGVQPVSPRPRKKARRRKRLMVVATTMRR